MYLCATNVAETNRFARDYQSMSSIATLALSSASSEWKAAALVTGAQ
jgi:hypothetical protein